MSFFVDICIDDCYFLLNKLTNLSEGEFYEKLAVLAIAFGFACVPSFAQYDDDYGDTPAATEDDSYSTEESTQAEPAEESESAAPASEKSSDDTDYK